jgi:hypothetical protein
LLSSVDRCQAAPYPPSDHLLGYLAAFSYSKDGGVASKCSLWFDVNADFSARQVARPRCER